MEYSQFLKDVDASKDLAKKKRKLIRKNECFNNVARLCLREGVCLEHPDWRIAYGFVGTGEPGLYFVHSFFFDTSSQKVIDPTIPEQVSVEAQKNGYYIALLLTYAEYLDAVTQCNNPGAWQNPIFEKACRRLMKWGFEHGMAFCG